MNLEKDFCGGRQPENVANSQTSDRPGYHRQRGSVAGLLGTVIGLISVFVTFSQETTVIVGIQAGGISQAQVTTNFDLGASYSW